MREPSLLAERVPLPEGSRYSSSVDLIVAFFALVMRGHALDYVMRGLLDRGLVFCKPRAALITKRLLRTTEMGTFTLHQDFTLE